MKIYFAPMEGITRYPYRNAHNTHFGYIDKYFTPFIVPNTKKLFRTREKADVLPENNQGLPIVPQIMTNKADEFLCAARGLKEYGYTEVNLNLGCPSKTVVSGGRGSGFLAFPDRLLEFLDEIFEKADMKISVKTRIGKENPEEFERLMEIYNKFPMEELIIHPRLQKDFYKNKPNIDAFREALSVSKNPICYNGDINTAQDYLNFREQFPQVETLMLGRGLLRDPVLSGRIKEGITLNKKSLRSFHDDIYNAYRDILSGDINVLYKMKEIWLYMALSFHNYEKYLKKIKKADKLIKYDDAVNALFEEQECINAPGSGI